MLNFLLLKFVNYKTNGRKKRDTGGVGRNKQTSEETVRLQNILLISNAGDP